MDLQPDQCADAWDDFVSPYERMFEPLTDAFASQVFDRLGSLDDLRLVDVACGPGGAALLAARRGADVVAVDASAAMIDRAAARNEPGLRLAAKVVYAADLDCADDSMDIAYSGFGVILLPDPTVALRQISRVLRPGGRAAIVTWTEPQNYELAAFLRAAAVSVLGERPPPTEMPAQLRYTDPTTFAQLLTTASLVNPVVQRMEAVLHVPSVRSLVENLAFAPGMTATLASFGADRTAILARFASMLQQRLGEGPIKLRAVAHAAIACKAK
jgi:ubiquinone/menaquinone biosynthesis C-methylase UbiE